MLAHSHETGSGLDVAYDLQQNLSPTATRLLDALQQVARLVGAARGYHRQTSQVTFFAPVESVAVSIGVSRQTIYNRLPELVDRGLVAQRGHYATVNGQTRMDGSLWAVKVRDTPSAAKIDHDYMKVSYRSLGSDIASGRTAWSLYSQSPRNTGVIDISCVLLFALPPTQNPLANDCKADSAPVLESLLDVPYAPLEGRGDAVDGAAQAMSKALGTPAKDINLMRWIVWQLVRLSQVQGRDFFYSVFLVAQRAGVEKRENACSNPTGLFVSRLKSAGIWSELKNAPPARVGARPLKA